jgi:hypothetical protein
MKYIILILLFSISCAKKEVSQPQSQAPQPRPQCEFINMGHQFMFCKNNLCCNGVFGYPYADCTYR